MNTWLWPGLPNIPERWRNVDQDPGYATRPSLSAVFVLGWITQQEKFSSMQVIRLFSRQLEGYNYCHCKVANTAASSGWFIGTPAFRGGIEMLKRTSSQQFWREKKETEIKLQQKNVKNLTISTVWSWDPASNHIALNDWESQWNTPV